MSSLTPMPLEEVQRIALLARLSLSTDAAVRLQRDLSQIIEYVKLLRELEPSATGLGSKADAHVSSLNRLASDEPQVPMATESLLHLAPASEGRFIVVPSALHANDSAAEGG